MRERISFRFHLELKNEDDYRLAERLLNAKQNNRLSETLQKALLMYYLEEDLVEIDTRFAVLENDRVIFVGTLPDCEEYLDSIRNKTQKSEIMVNRANHFVIQHKNKWGTTEYLIKEGI